MTIRTCFAAASLALGFYGAMSLQASAQPAPTTHPVQGAGFGPDAGPPPGPDGVPNPVPTQHRYRVHPKRLKLLPELPTH